LAGLTTIAVVCGAGSAAWADPFADEALFISRVTPGYAITGERINTSWDNGDDGRDAAGAPDVENGRSGLTLLGFDAMDPRDPDDDRGGQLAVRFNDNVCADGEGPDIKVYDAGSDESAMVEVSDNDGQSFKMVGYVGPTEGFELDIKGKAGPFTQVRLTATNHAGSTNTAGIDVDAVECLHAPDPNAPPPDTANVDTGADGCDLVGSSRWYSRGRRAEPLDKGIDVDSVTAKPTSDGSSIIVTLDLCGKLSERTVYAVYFDYTDRTEMAGDTSEDDGPDTLDGNLRCRRTHDHTAYYYRGRERGGLFSLTSNIDEKSGEDKDQLELTVDFADMNRATFMEDGSEVLLWVETRGRGYIRDHVPNTETGDRCGRPQFEKEVIRVVVGSVEDPAAEEGSFDPDVPR